MPRHTPTKGRIVARLTQNSALLSELMRITKVRPLGIRSAISRLRDEGFRIVTETTSESGNPRYTMLSGPESMGNSFVCPSCRNHIRLGQLYDHSTLCEFGPAALENLLSNGTWNKRMTRTVQIELTLDLEADCYFANGAWQVRNIETVQAYGLGFSPAMTIKGLLLTSPRIVDKIAEAFAQQEP